MSIDDIRTSANAGRLVVVLGAGASMALTQKSKVATSWGGLVQSGLDYAFVRSLVTEVQHDRYVAALQSDDIDDLLGVAEFVGRKLEAPDGGPYARWMRSVFESWSPELGAMHNALRAIDDQKIQIATLNYDTLVEVCTGLQTIDFADNEGLMAWVRKERPGVLHLHGVWNKPQDCVFGIRDYHSALSDERRDLVQRYLGSMNRILFIGCGDTLTDPNFSALIRWLKSNIGSNVPQHYALVRSDEVDKRLGDPAWRGFVEPLSYGKNHGDLPGFLLNCFPTRSSQLAKASKAKISAGREAQVLDAYRNFLLRDCGEMTIEGMRADMETAQRKFDLEKLFVPLDVVPFPPEIPIQDPDRENKLQEWRAKHAKPVSFGSAFQKTKKIALLALPGGGKTLLLKRLAVAYASSSRREASSDDLPSLDLLPLMIRCREWKDEIRKPIPTLLKNIATITGDGNLEGLVDALEKPLKSGSVLLLVDGLDEIHDDGDRSIFVENLEKFLTSYPKIRLLVTSREAGFDLVAPCLVRFCSKFKIAPLSEAAITSLCGHWHRLMGGGAPEAIIEGENVAATLVASDSLRRLAENPLLLTMLLVVKHGAGRLPPDRVSLYDRAVEVLLDTWNIKGHEALNLKEAVPQLACLAFEMLRVGKQTATEREILNILEEARETLPMVERYAKDSPHAFLKRVELRSSLMLEAGHTNENGKTVPFYQFRHLTFQEYLAAVAAVDGHTLSSERGSSLLSALDDNLVSDEWKEVIPMAAVLARKQAEPLLEALVKVAETEKDGLLEQYHLKRESRAFSESRLPPSTGRLVQAMIEEAIFTSETLKKAAHLVAFFVAGCRSNDNWQALSRGPYGQDIRDAAYIIYSSEPYGALTFSRNTVALMEAFMEPSAFWTNDCEAELLSRLAVTDAESLARSILSIAGSFWIHREDSNLTRSVKIYERLEEGLFDDRWPVQTASAWTWGFWRHLQKEGVDSKPIPQEKTVARLISLFFEDQEQSGYIINFTISHLDGVARGACTLKLDAIREKKLRAYVASKIDEEPDIRGRDLKIAIVRIAFMLADMFTDKEISDFILQNDFSRHEKILCQDILIALGLDQLIRESLSVGRRSKSKSIR